MLALTDNAVEAVQEILSSSEATPERSGLRWLPIRWARKPTSS
jgi:hypothetical protein